MSLNLKLCHDGSIACVSARRHLSTIHNLALAYYPKVS